MASANRIIVPITGAQAGREILLDLAQWSDNLNNNRDAMDGRKTQKQLSDMLYGLQTNEDVKIYNEYRSLQEYLHDLWGVSKTISREALTTWIQLTRELELVSLAACHDDELLLDFKPRAYLDRETLSQDFAFIVNNARWSQAQCTLVGVIADALIMPELNSLKSPLVIEDITRAKETRRLEKTRERLIKSGLDGAAELEAIIAALPELETEPKTDPEVLRRAKAVMRHKKPFIERAQLARDIIFGNAR